MSNWLTYKKYLDKDGEWKVAVREYDELIEVKTFVTEVEADDFIKSELSKQVDENMSDQKKNRKKEVESAKGMLEDSMDSLLNGGDLLQDSADNDGDLPQVTPNVRHDYVTMKTSASDKAKKTIGALMKFYLDEDIIEKDQYVQARKRIDEMTLSSLMFQLETAEQALVTLLRTIDSGELAPRMFEVLGTLQKSMLDIIKSQTMYLVAAEESVKKLSRDVEIYTDRKNKKLENNGSGNKGSGTLGRGTKNLMQNIQEEVKRDGYDTDTDNIEDIDADDVE